MKLGKSQLINLAMIAALLATALIGHRLSPLLMPKVDITAVADPGCDLQHQACSATLPQGGRLELSITPRPIPFLQNLQVEVKVDGVEAKKIEVDFAGETMNMGFNRSQLTVAGNGRHSGQTSLPVCVSGSMAWVATVLVETDRQRIAVPFRFATGH